MADWFRHRTGESGKGRDMTTQEQHKPSKPVTQRIHLVGNILGGAVAFNGLPENDHDARELVRYSCNLANMALATIADDGRKHREGADDARGNQNFED